MPPKDKEFNFFSSQATDYSNRSSSGVWGLIRSIESRNIFRLLQPNSGEYIADFGCGDGFYARSLRYNFSCKVFAVDYSRQMINSLNKKYPKIETATANLSTTNNFGSFDKILAAGVMEFIEHPETFLSNCRNNLKDSGSVVLLLPLSGPVGAIYKWYHELQKCPVFVRNFKQNRKFIVDSGFIIEQVSYCGPISYAIKLKARSYSPET